MTKELYKPPMKNGSSIPREPRSQAELASLFNAELKDNPFVTFEDENIVEEFIPKYEFILPAGVIHKGSPVQNTVRNLVNRYFYMCLGRSRWHEDFTIICTGDQYLNFVIAARQLIPQDDPGLSLDWLNNFTIHVESSFQVHEPFLHTVRGRGRGTNRYDRFKEKMLMKMSIDEATLYDDGGLMGGLADQLDIEEGVFTPCDIIVTAEQYLTFIDGLQPPSRIDSLNAVRIDAADYIEGAKLRPHPDMTVDVTSCDRDYILNRPRKDD